MAEPYYILTVMKQSGPGKRETLLPEKRNNGTISAVISITLLFSHNAGLMLIFPNIPQYSMEPSLKKDRAVVHGFFFKKKLLVLIGIYLSVFLFDFTPQPVHAKFIQLDMALDVKSRFSDGCSSIQEIASLAQHRGIDAVVFSDHFRDSLQYGIRPLEKIFNTKIETPSVAVSGINTYLAEISLNNKTFTHIHLLPSIESSPFYYWTGNPLRKKLVAHDRDKHLAIIGLENSKDYEGLPTLNGNFSKRYIGQAQVRFLFLGFLFFISVVLVVLYRDNYPKSVYVFLTVAILLLANNHPFISSPYNQYNGNQGSDPYQEVIDYVNDRGGMVFWNHLETDYRRQALGDSSMYTKTRPHPTDLLLTNNYTGFQAVNDTPITASDPGKEWDQTLIQYIRGERAKPVWGYGSNDFHCEGQDGHKLGSVRTIALVSENSKNDMFNALRTGRMYAVRKSGENDRLSLDDISVRDRTTGNKATLGQELVASDFPEITIDISSTQGGVETAHLTLIRNGKIVKEETASLPHKLVWRDLDVELNGKAYYRLKAESGAGDLLLSNPIFVKFSGAELKVASITERIKRSIMKSKEFKISEPSVPPDSKFEEQKIKIFETEPDPPKTPVAPKKQVTKPRISVAPKKKVTEPRLPPPPVVVKREKAVVANTVSEFIKPPSLKPQEKSEPGKYVYSLLDGLSLKKGPGEIFPDTGTAVKGERLLFVRRTSIMHKDKPWIVVKINGQMYYVWEGFVQFE